jgi:hypothetical protein
MMVSHSGITTGTNIRYVPNRSYRCASDKSLGIGIRDLLTAAMIPSELMFVQGAFSKTLKYMKKAALAGGFGGLHDLAGKALGLTADLARSANDQIVMAFVAPRPYFVVTITNNDEHGRGQ